MAKWRQRVVALSCALALSAVSSSGDQTVVTFAKRGTVIGLTAEEQSPNLAGPELSRYGDEVVGYVKCSGHRLLALMCSPALRKYLAAGQARSCTVYDRVGEPH